MVARQPEHPPLGRHFIKGGFMKKILVFVLAILFLSNAYGASFTITIPDNKVAEVIEAFAIMFGYPEIVEDVNGDDIPNPQSKAEFAKEKIREMIKETYLRYKARQAEYIVDNAVGQAEEEIDVMTVE